MLNADILGLLSNAVEMGIEIRISIADRCQLISMLRDGRVTKKVQPVLGGYDKSKFITERLWAQSEGVKVPISLVYRQDLVRLDGSDPLLLNGCTPSPPALPLDLPCWALLQSCQTLCYFPLAIPASSLDEGWGQVTVFQLCWMQHASPTWP